MLWNMTTAPRLTDGWYTIYGGGEDSLQLAHSIASESAFRVIRAESECVKSERRDRGGGDFVDEEEGRVVGNSLILSDVVCQY